MSLVRRIGRRLRALTQRNAVERELDTELRFHLDMEQQKNERLGMSPDEARRAALLTFGGVDIYKEAARDVRGVRPIEKAAQDLRYGLRTMRRTPVFTAIVLVTLALGIGATSAIFSIVNAVLLRPLPYAHSEQLVRVYSQVPDGTIDRFSVSILDFMDFKARNRVFSDMAMWLNSTMTLTQGDEPERLSVVSGSENLFSVLGVAPLHGRLFAPGDAARGGVIALSYGLWERRFGSDPSLVGKTITVDGAARTVIAVLPAGFRLYTRDVDAWTPLDVNQVYNHENRSHHVLRVAARLRPGVRVEDAQRDMRRVAAELAAEYPKADQGWAANVFSMRREIVGDIQRPLIILLAASGLVLLIACINVASLQLTRGAARARELAVRRALGASRSRLLGQLLVESLALAMLGGVLGLAVGAAGMRALVAVAPTGQISRLDEVSLDGRVLAFAFAVSVITGLLFGLWPALRGSDPELGATLRDGGRTGSGGQRAARVRAALVVAEVSLALTLVVGAALVLQSFRKIVDIDLGFRADQMVALRLTLPGRYGDSAQTPFYRELQRRVLAMPGIVAMSAADRAPAQGSGISTDIRLIERPEANASGTLYSAVTVALPEYFRTLGMRLLKGRDLTWGPNEKGIVVNASAADRFWPGDDPLGKHLGFSRRGTDTGYTVVGVVSDVRRGDITVREDPMVYLPLSEAGNLARNLSIVVRGSLGTTATVNAVRRTIHEMDPALPIYDTRTVSDIVGDAVAQPRLNTTLLTSFALLALLLAIVGIYGVVSYSVTQRQQELGLRMALGARPGDVFRLVVRQGARLATVGVILGLAASLLLTPVLRSWLYEMEPSDPLTFAAVAAILIGAALTAAAIPARRATKVDPVLAMRGE